MTLEEVTAAGKNPTTSYELSNRLLERIDAGDIDTARIQSDLAAIIKQAKAETLAEVLTRIETIAKLKL